MTEKLREQTHKFFIAGVQFHNLKKVINKLNEGDVLSLVPEPSNQYDPNAVRIEHLDYDEQTMCGYVPKKFSSEVSSMITLGMSPVCKISSLNPSAKPWEMCEVTIEKDES
jgi:hypothetical protein